MRKPILLSKNTCAFIWMFSRSDEFEDECYKTNENYNGFTIWQVAAKQFVSQLKRKWCRCFLEALIKECQQELEKDQNIIEHHLGFYSCKFESSVSSKVQPEGVEHEGA
jgi:hypothetical protein